MTEGWKGGRRQREGRNQGEGGRMSGRREGGLEGGRTEGDEGRE